MEYSEHLVFFCSYFYQQGGPDHVSEALTEYRLRRTPKAYPVVDWCALSVVPEVRCLQDQLDIVSSLSNYHWKIRGKKQEVGFLLMFSPGTEKYHPSSLRNKLIFFCAKDDREGQTRTLQQVLMSGIQSRAEDDSNIAGPSQPRQYRSRLVKVTVEMLRERAGIESFPHSTRDVSIYSAYACALVESGTLLWRVHSNERDVLCFNDCDPEVGEFIPCSFVHITMEHAGEETLFSCTCDVYKLIKGTPVDVPENDAVDHSLSCVHCRFACSEVLPLLGRLFGVASTSRSLVHSRLMDSLRSLNTPVVRVGPIHEPVTKFSVVGFDHSCGFVHLIRSGSAISCQSGECAVRSFGRKRSMKRLGLDDSDRLCAHLEAMKANREVWGGLDAQEIEEPSDNHLDVPLADPEVKKIAGLCSIPFLK